MWIFNQPQLCEFVLFAYNNVYTEFSLSLFSIIWHWWHTHMLYSKISVFFHIIDLMQKVHQQHSVSCRCSIHTSHRVNASHSVDSVHRKNGPVSLYVPNISLQWNSAYSRKHINIFGNLKRKACIFELYIIWYKWYLKIPWWKEC